MFLFGQRTVKVPELFKVPPGTVKEDPLFWTMYVYPLRSDESLSVSESCENLQSGLLSGLEDPALYHHDQEVLLNESVTEIPVPGWCVRFVRDTQLCSGGSSQAFRRDYPGVD